MNRTFDFYEYAGVIVPGATLLVGLFFLFPEARILFGKEGVTLGELGVFVVIAYAAGQLVQGVGNCIEWIWWKLRGGFPSTLALTGNLLSANQHERLLKLLHNDTKISVDFGKSTVSDRMAVVREVYSRVAQAGRASRVDVFNGNYGLVRGLAAVFVLLLVAALAIKETTIASVLFLLLCFSIQRMNRFGEHYARELFIQYLLIAKKS